MATVTQNAMVRQSRELLNRAGDEGVALLDVDGLGEPSSGEVGAAARDARVRSAPVATREATEHEVPVGDHLRERAGAHDLLNTASRPPARRRARWWR